MNAVRNYFFATGLVCLFSLLFILNLPAQSASDLSANLQALETADTTPASEVTIGGVYYSAKLVNVAGAAGLLPFPTSMNYPAWNLGDNVWLMDDLPTAAPAARVAGARTLALADASPPDLDDTNDDGGDYTNISYLSLPPVNTNLLWLQITNVASGLVYANLNKATDTVYAIWSTTNLLTPLADWQVATELWPTNGTKNVMPFTVNANGNANLFLTAEDWTGIYTNGLPISWLWQYFQNLNYSASDVDSLGTNTLGYDFTNHLDPNVIQFSLQFTNTDLNTAIAYGTIAIQTGMPSYIAVLINDTNQADADWQPYGGTNLAVSLTSGNGLYNVQIGLRGLPSNARPSWVAVQLTLNNLAPTFTVTSPTNSTVSVPMIQLQGYVSAALSSLTYDVSNAAGIFTNQSGYCHPAFYDTNLLAFTTNSFQCYDIALTNGLNQITLHATDVAGNTATTNFSYTLDYSGDTNPPVLSILWPTNGTSVAGSNVTVQAQMDDATATVTATINSNSVAGLVERNGAVWLNNLPINSGTNTITITATDAAGNMSTTNLTVIQSAVSLTINPLSSGQMNQTNVTVSGTIGDPSQKIIINGVLATVTGTNWTATNVPVGPYGTASFNAQVTDSGNNPLAVQSMYQPQSAQVVLASYQSQTNYTYQTTFFAFNRSFYNVEIDSIGIYWSYGSGGVSHYHETPYDTEASPYDITTTLPAGVNGFSSPWKNVGAKSNFEGEGIAEPDYPEQISSYSYNQTQTHVMIQPSGQQSIGQTVLYLVQAQVTNEDTGLRLLAGAVRFMNQLAGTTTEDVTNSDGSVWSQGLVAAPAGVNVEVTPQAVGNISFTGMKISPAKIIYFSILDNANIPSSFRNNASTIQSTLQSELLANVFNNLVAGQSVQIKVHIDSSWPSSSGWSDASKHIYVNQVSFDYNNLAYNENVAERDLKGGIAINLNWFANNLTSGTQYVTAQGWVNLLAHEGMGNVAVKNDCIFDCTDYEIFSRTQSYDNSNPFTVSSDSRLTILNACGLNSN